MKGLDSANAGGARTLSRGGGREVRALGRERRIRRGKGSLDEQEVGILDEANDRLAIGWRVGGVGDISDFLARGDRHRVAQPPERQYNVWRCRRRADTDRMVVRPVLEHSALECPQPRADRQSQFPQPVFPDIDMRDLLDRKRQGRGAMLENRGRDPEGGLIADHAADDPAAAHRLLDEPGLQAEPGRPGRKRRINFGHHE